MPPVTDATLLRYCCTLYDLLETTASEAELGNVWEGKITEVFKDTGISNSHYGKVMDVFYRCGAAEQLRRGARGAPTQILLKARPDEEMIASVFTPGLTSDTPHAMLMRRIEVLERRLQGIDLVKLLDNFEKRLRRVETDGKKP